MCGVPDGFPGSSQVCEPWGVEVQASGFSVGRGSGVELGEAWVPGFLGAAGSWLPQVGSPGARVTGK